MLLITVIGLAKSYLSTLRRSQERRHKRKSVQSLTDSTKGSRPRLRHVSSASSTENTEEKDGEVPVFSDTLEGIIQLLGHCMTTWYAMPQSRVKLTKITIWWHG